MPKTNGKGNRATIEALCAQVADLTGEVRALSVLVASRPAAYTALIGWKAIGAYFGKSARTARRYAQLAGLPTYRVGAHRISSGALIDGWGMIREKDRPRWRKYRQEVRGHRAAP